MISMFEVQTNMHVSRVCMAFTPNVAFFEVTFPSLVTYFQSSSPNTARPGVLGKDRNCHAMYCNA